MFLGQFVRAPILAPGSFEPAVQAVNRALRRRDSSVAEVICLLLAIIGIALWFGGHREQLIAEDAANMLVSGLVLTLVLFILARVFRLGTAMRDDLEGTV